MTTISPVIGHEVLVQVGNGAEPEVFARPALINTSRSLSVTTNTESDELVDIDDQSLPAETVRRVRSNDVKIDGAGMVHSSSVKEYLDWAMSGEAKNVKVDFGNAVLTGPFILTQFEIGGDRAKTTEAQITLEQAGACTVTSAS